MKGSCNGKAVSRFSDSLGLQIHQRKANKNKSKEEKNLDLIQITMKEKIYLYRFHPQYKLALIPP